MRKVLILLVVVAALLASVGCNSNDALANRNYTLSQKMRSGLQSQDASFGPLRIDRAELGGSAVSDDDREFLRLLDARSMLWAERLVNLGNRYKTDKLKDQINEQDGQYEHMTRRVEAILRANDIRFEYLDSL